MVAESPFFSIVVPTFNRPQQLRTLLACLCRLDYPSDRFEVILVDDGGSEPLQELVAAFGDRLALTLLRTPHVGPAPARQTGIRIARGKYLAFIDDDCLPCPDWLATLADAFAAYPDQALGGRTCNSLPDNPYSTASQLLITYLYERFNTDPGEAQFFTTNNVAFPAALFQEVGGLDDAWSTYGGEDRDLCHRWRHHGYRMRYVPEAVVYHAHPLSLRTFWRQHFNYGKGAFHFRRHRARREGSAFRLEPLSFYLGIPRIAWSAVPLQSRLCTTVLLLVSQGANAAGFLTEWFRMS